MKLSTRGAYGLRAMSELALNYGKGPISLKTIANRQTISEAYLEQLFGSLRRQGLIQSTRGSRGGYSLSRSPEEIHVGEIIRTLEGPIGPMQCVATDEPPCERAAGCVTKGVWEKVRNSVAEVLDSITLAQMCVEATTREESE